ncbi:MAG TPA: DNA primase, partial [Rugosimonospora sp.]|nr:DNA primase [Rugosimonospora sp.]
MARQRSDAPTSTDGADQSSRAASTDELWSAARIDVVEIALPGGAGYTLRAYRSDEEVEGTDISDREVEAFPDRHRTSRVYDHDEKALHDDEADETQDHDFDRDFAAEDTDTGELDPAELDDLDEVDAGTDSDSDPDADGDDDADGEDEADGEDDEEEEEEVEAEEIPIFLGYRGKLLLFKSPEGLVDFVKSGAPHDMEQLEGWSEVVEKVTAEDIDPLPEDTYELDLVVKNLRGSRDTWDAELLIRAGEIAR